MTEFGRAEMGIGEAEGRCAAGLGEGGAVTEIGVAEVGVPVKTIVNGVINPAAVFATESDIQRGDSIVLQKGREIRAGAEGADALIAALADFFAILGGFGGGYFV